MIGRTGPMGNGNFVSADTTKIAAFQKESAEACKEFSAIRKEFAAINKKILSVWKGIGADAYKYETDNILEKIGSIDDVLDEINNSAVKDIKEQYSKCDEELAECNRKQYESE